MTSMKLLGFNICDNENCQCFAAVEAVLQARAVAEQKAADQGMPYGFKPKRKQEI